MVKSLRYDIVDVFAARPYGGNPLAVVHGADTLTTAAMQAIAREFNLSETVFVMPATVPDADYRVRIFTPAIELPFAGHPSIGAAWLLARDGVIARGPVRQQCGTGVISVDVDAGGASIAGDRPEMGDAFDAVSLATAVGLTPADVVGPGMPRAAAAGAPFAFLRVHDEAVARARPDHAAIVAATPGMVGLVLFSYDPEPAQAHVRMFAPASGVPEDPGGGASALALAVHAVHHGLLAANTTSSFSIKQGMEIGRPSVLQVRVRAERGEAVRTTVGGAVVAVARGELLRLP